MKNCLILNSCNKLPKNYQIHFLGYWCIKHIKNSFKNISKFKIFNLELSNTEINYNIKLNNAIYSSLLKDIAKKLNTIHKKKYSIRYWEIVVGPWLKKFIDLVHERFYSLEKILKKKKFDYIVLANYQNFNFYTHDHNDLVFKKNIKSLEDWNFVLYTKIFDFLNLKIPRKNIKVQNSQNGKFLKIKKNIFKNFIKRTIYFVLSFLISPNSFFIYKPDLRFFENLKLQFKMGQVPAIYNEVRYKKAKKNFKIRDEISFKKKGGNKVEKFIRSILPDLLPTNVIENYEYLDKLINKQRWPNQPKAIFTSYAYCGDDVFQMWLAKKVEKGTKYFLAQHSGNHITGKPTLTEPGFDTCDKFLAWGKKGNNKCIPFFNTKNISIYNNFNNEGKKIYFFAPRMYPRRTKPYDDYGEMIRENIKLQKILKGIHYNLQNNIILKLYPTDYQDRKFEKKILDEIVFKNKKYKMDSSYTLKKSIFNKSRIIVHLSDGTGILETLSANIPCVFIMPNLNLIRKDVKKDFESLVKAKILFFNSRDLSEHINDYYFNIEKWWKNKEVIKVKKLFCEKYCNPAPIDYLDKFKILYKKDNSS